MKKLILAFSLCLILFSCKKESTNNIPITDFVSNKKASALIEADTKFGLELFSQVTEMTDAPENIMISPVSVAVALGMTYNGADGDTKTAFEETLRFKGYSRDEINTIHQSLVNHLLRADPKVIMEIANSIWYRNDFDVLQSFIEVNKIFYDAEVAGLDFWDPATRDIINSWCAEKTHDKIKDVLDEIKPNVVMYLINAIYFNGTWTYQFDETKSFVGDFYKEDASLADAGYMMMQKEVGYMSNDLFSAINLPYGNENFVMSIILPKPGKTIEELVAQMNMENYTKWTADFTKKEVIVTIPKFKFGYKDLLNDPLINMGLEVAFTEQADFTGINPGGGLLISRVIHQSFIDVNEKGTEAAAVTVVEIIKNSTEEPVDPNTYFTANHPFIFVIREKTSNAVLFIGKVGNPVY